MVISIGARVRELREAMRWSMRELARRSTLSPAYISKLEAGGVPRPGYDALQRLAVAFGRSLADLVAGTGRVVPAQALDVVELEGLDPNWVRDFLRYSKTMSEDQRNDLLVQARALAERARRRQAEQHALEGEAKA
jgi:transcriptional regulator with XRE-family HTH domain